MENGLVVTGILYDLLNQQQLEAKQQHLLLVT